MDSNVPPEEKLLYKNEVFQVVGCAIALTRGERDHLGRNQVASLPPHSNCRPDTSWKLALPKTESRIMNVD